MTPTKFWRAVNIALTEAMESDPSVVVLGEDVAAPGGPYGLTRGLLDRFGPERVRDTPISEACLMACAVGAAMSGLRPVVEIMYLDFITLVLGPLVNQAAKYRFFTGAEGSLPLVVHTMYGGRASMGAQHSQSLEAWLAHVPGLKVAFPSTPQDAHDVLRDAIADPDPVVVIEPIALLKNEGDLSASDGTTIGRARLVREGHQATVVGWGPTVAICDEALGASGIKADLIDLRWLQPWDEDLVRSSFRRTGRLLVVHDAVQVGGWGAEIIATVVGEEFSSLDAPPRRVGAAPSAVPVTSERWRQVLPSIQQVEAALKDLIAF